MHDFILRAIKFNHVLDLVFSTDDNGIIEVWDPETFGKYLYYSNYL
jgi:hypothetical protein